ncbi:SCP2 sterol-binding domain-containing protein, partial [Pseudomonas syringae pv. coryli]
MLLRGLLASIEHGINRVLRLDSTALPRMARLSGRVIAVDCRDPSLKLFILPSDEGLLLAADWAAEADCTLRAPASSLVRLALSKDKTAVLHGPDVELDGDSGALLELVG